MRTARRRRCPECCGRPFRWETAEECLSLSYPHSACHRAGIVPVQWTLASATERLAEPREVGAVDDVVPVGVKPAQVQWVAHDPPECLTEQGEVGGIHFAISVPI